jgi:putative transcriptional regulator
LGELFKRVAIPLQPGFPTEYFSNLPVYAGGPVQSDRGFVLHRTSQQWQSSLKVTDELALTSSRDILHAMSCAEQPVDVLVTLGYAGWTAGQLEWELAQNAWLTVEASPHILFNVPSEERLTAAMRLLGIDFANLSEVAGHA